MKTTLQTWYEKHQKSLNLATGLPITTIPCSDTGNTTPLPAMKTRGSARRVQLLLQLLTQLPAVYDTINASEPHDFMEQIHTFTVIVSEMLSFEKTWLASQPNSGGGGILPTTKKRVFGEMQVSTTNKPSLLLQQMTSYLAKLYPTDTDSSSNDSSHNSHWSVVSSRALEYFQGGVVYDTGVSSYWKSLAIKDAAIAVDSVGQQRFHLPKALVRVPGGGILIEKPDFMHIMQSCTK